MLVEAFKALRAAAERRAPLIVAGDGPYLPQMKEALAGLPARNSSATATTRSSARSTPGADLLVFPSRTDTLGQVVMERRRRPARDRQQRGGPEGDGGRRTERAE